MRLRPAALFALSLTFTALQLAPDAASAGELRRFRTAPFPAASTGAAAEAFLSSRLGELGLDGVELEHVRSLGTPSIRTERFEQRYEGLPVLGTSVAVRLDEERRVLAAHVEVVSGLFVASTPSLDELDAAQVVAAFSGVSAPVLSSILAVLPDESADAGARLVWQLDVNDRLGASRWLVDAHDGSVLSERGLAVDAVGRVYKISSVKTPTPTDEELLDLDVEDPQKLDGWSGNLRVTQYGSGPNMDDYVVSQDLVASSGSDFLYDPPASDLDPADAFAQVNLYYHLTSMRRFFQDDLGVDTSAPSWKLTAVANVLDQGQPYDNAFFSEGGITGPFGAPNLIGIGQGSQTDLAYDSDIFKHEFVHYADQNAIGYSLGQTGFTKYGLEPHSGSIDEGVADYFACSENGDPILGEASLAGQARDLTITDKVCPQDMFGEVHADGELIGSFAWTVRTIVGKKAGDQLVWGGLAMLPKGASFTQFANALLATAADLQVSGNISSAQLDAIKTAVTARGLDECDHVIPLHPGEPRTSNLYGLDIVGQIVGVSCEALTGAGVEAQNLYHWSWSPAPGDASVTFTVELSPQAGAGYRLLVRTGKTVGFAETPPLPTADQYDYEFVSASASLTATLDASSVDKDGSPLPFDPTEVYYAVVVHQNCPGAQLVLTAVAPGQGGGGAGGGGAGGSTGGGGAGGGLGGEGGGLDPTTLSVEGGCGCSVPGRDRGLGLVAAALAASLALARRRSQGR